MKSPVQDLKDEHSGILLMLDIMKKVINGLKNRQGIKIEHLEKITEFLVNFADKCHHTKEEEILFPEVIREKSNTALVNELLGEHKSGRDLISGISQSLKNYEPGKPDAYHIASNMELYISLLTEHIKKENQSLFPVVEKQIPENVQMLIQQRFDTLEREVIGEGKHEEYHSWLKDLKEIYK